MLRKLGHGFHGFCILSTGEESPYLESAVAGVCCDLDVTIADSYGGTGQVWANLTTAPADGSAQSAYDFYRGASVSAGASDPTFTGSAGDPAAYWAFDGGDYFTLAGSNTALINSFNHTGAAFTEIITFRTASALSLFKMHDTAVTVSTDEGTVNNFQANGRIFNNITKSGANASVSSAIGALTVNTDTVYIRSYNAATATHRRWINSRTKSEQSLTSPGSSNPATHPLKLFAAGDGSSPITSGSRGYSYALLNVFIDDAEAASIIDHLNARHGRTYA